jgi:hypothetical protein
MRRTLGSFIGLGMSVHRANTDVAQSQSFLQFSLSFRQVTRPQAWGTTLTRCQYFGTKFPMPHYQLANQVFPHHHDNISTSSQPATPSFKVLALYTSVNRALAESLIFFIFSIRFRPLIELRLISFFEGIQVI